MTEHIFIKPKVLIVDDIPENIKVLATLLSNEGVSISFASSAIQALDMLENKLPDLILLDVSMPHMDGFQLCRLIKSNERTNHIPIIFLTGRTVTEDLVKGFEVGAVDYIFKPFNINELRSRVRTHIELKRARDIISEQNTQLNIQNQQLAEMNASKDKFLSILAHDLRNPFNSILGYTDLLTNNFDEFELSKIKEIILSISSSATRGFELLTALLDWSLINANKMEWLPEEINVEFVCKEAIEMLHPFSEQKQIHISLEHIDNEAAYCFSDLNMLRTVLRNLLSNAIKFTQTNGTVILKVQSLENDVEITVADTGVGIANDDLQKLFRIDANYKTLGTANEKGSGIGLLICKDFIEKNGGQIWVESKVGIGSQFKFTLPKPNIVQF